MLFWRSLAIHYILHYKRVDPYLWIELAPVLEGSGSHRRHPREGTKVDRVFESYIRSTCRSSEYLLFVKNGFVVGARSLNVQKAIERKHSSDANTPCIVSVSRMARRHTIQCSLPNTHTVHIELDGGRQAGRQGCREGARKDRWWEGGSRGMVGSKGREWGSDDVREDRSGNEGREGGLRKGTSEEGT